MAKECSLSRQRRLFFITVPLLALQFYCENVSARKFLVGGSKGWASNIGDWPKGRTFNTGDELEFSYIRGKHNVVVVDKHGYDTCETPSGAYEQSSGFDHVYLKKGENYFICSKPGQCKLNMKMMINVE
nr:basic blue protein-like [Quercus suber]